MIADMVNNKKLNLMVIAMFIRDGKLHISIVFITQSYFKVPKDVLYSRLNSKFRLNSTHFLLLKFYYPNKRELQKIALNHLSDIDFKDFIKIYKKCVNHISLVIDTALPSENPLRFRKNLLK